MFMGLREERVCERASGRPACRDGMCITLPFSLGFLVVSNVEGKGTSVCRLLSKQLSHVPIVPNVPTFYICLQVSGLFDRASAVTTYRRECAS